MRELVYHVAVTADGFIAHEDHSIEGILEEGEHVDDYRRQLAEYDTALMGRRTYEFGYRYGLAAGQAPYEHMRNFVFSTGIELPEERAANLFVVRENPVEQVRALKAEDGGPLYLCGGGAFAGSLLQAGLIDRLLLKVNPGLFGRGIPLFRVDRAIPYRLELTSGRAYSNGIQLNDYRLLPA